LEGLHPAYLLLAELLFSYDPADGNLLVQFSTPFIFGAYQQINNALYESDDSGSLTSRFCDESECNEDQGLVTEFTSVTTPEPVSAGSVLFGLATLLCMAVICRGTTGRTVVVPEHTRLPPQRRESVRHAIARCAR
jgi:hypothetical protein